MQSEWLCVNWRHGFILRKETSWYSVYTHFNSFENVRNKEELGSSVTVITLIYYQQGAYNA